MGTYIKIFLQFPPDQVFWNKTTQFFLYASEIRGYYPLFQSLDHPDFLPGSGIIFVTVVAEQAYRVELQPDHVTKNEILKVLRNMFGEENVPEPIAFYYPRWTQTPWSRGSYSNWPTGTTLETHQNLRANLGRLYFAGEHTASQMFGFLHGAYFEGQKAGMKVANCLRYGICPDDERYESLMGTTMMNEYSPENGWMFDSFENYALEGEE